MIGNLIQHLYTVIDGIIVGNFVGEEALSAIGTSVPLVFLFLALAFGLSTGGGIIISQNFGAKRFDTMPVAASTTMILITGVGLVISALAFFLSPMILRNILGVPDYIFDLSLIYVRILSFGILFQFIYNGVAAILRSVGNAKVTLYFLLISSVINVILTLIVVVVLNQGVAGAAVTTTVSQFVAAVISYIYMVKKYPYLKPRAIFDTALCKQALKLGLPVAMQHGVISIGAMAFGRLVNSFGVISIASFAVAMRIEGFAFMPILAFNASMTTFAGQNIGANRFDRVKRGMFQAQLMAAACCLVIVLCLMIFAIPISRLFGLEGETLLRSVEQIRFISPWLVVLSIALIIIGTLKGAGDVMFPTLAQSLNFFLRVALAYFLVDIGVLGYNGAWVTVPIGWVLLLVLVLYRYYSGKWESKGVVKST